MQTPQTTYKDAGVDISAGDSFVDLIRQRTRKAWPDEGDDLAGFAGRFKIPPGATDGCFSMDGSGTLSQIAGLMGLYHALGQKTAACAIPDVFAAGALPTDVGDKIQVNSLDPQTHIAIVEGIIDACKDSGAVLRTGETAECPGTYRRDWYADVDITTIGFPDTSICPADPQSGDNIYGWLIDNPACNGLSLVRKVLKLDGKPSVAGRNLERNRPELHGRSLAEVLLGPTPIYIKRILELDTGGVNFRKHANITGGGLELNIPRILPNSLVAVIDKSRWQRPPIFSLIQKAGNVAVSGDGGMDQTFNNGIIFVSICDARCPQPSGNDVVLIGHVEARSGEEPQVRFVNDYRDK